MRRRTSGSSGLSMATWRFSWQPRRRRVVQRRGSRRYLGVDRRRCKVSMHRKDGNFEKVSCDTPQMGDEQYIAYSSQKASELRM